jgi:hypothetical protein
VRLQAQHLSLASSGNELVVEIEPARPPVGIPSKSSLAAAENRFVRGGYLALRAPRAPRGWRSPAARPRRGPGSARR